MTRVRSPVPLALLRRRAAARRGHADRAKQDGIELVALTDHDTVDGVERGARGGRRSSGSASPPRRRSASVDGAHEDLHVCGYELDVERRRRCSTALEDFRARPRAPHRGDGRPPARSSASPSTAPCSRSARRRASRSGARTSPTAVLEHPDNQERLAAEGITDKNDVLPGVHRPRRDGLRRARGRRSTRRST